MRMYDIIMNKRNGGVLSKEEIEYFVDGYTNGSIPDYQASALMMAIYFQKMNFDETFNLTIAMEKSGDILDLSGINGVKVDKHSTGGVGDKTSLVLGPMVASVGAKLAKMSGRGLGHTGGTIDKLECFEGFSTALSEDKFISNVNNIGIAITGQTGNLTPADKKIYALRDVTATVDNISLIASSIMSKKLAAGADAIVLDVKTGSGAFMKSESSAFELAKEMVRIGNCAGKNTIAIVSDMDQPLGNAIGNALEVKEAIDTLRGHGPEDLQKLCMTLGANMLVASQIAKDKDEAERMLNDAISSGKALDKMAEFVQGQGGRKEDVYDYSNLPKASYEIDVTCYMDGYVEDIQSERVGIASMILGGGRETKESIIDPAVGIIIHKKVGDAVRIGESFATIYANDSEKITAAKEKLIAAYTFSKHKHDKHQLIKGVITKDTI